MRRQTLCLAFALLAGGLASRLAVPSEDRAGWPLFEPSSPGCGLCGTVAVESLKDRTDHAVGCISKTGAFSEMVPLCQLQGGDNQAGGHAGTIAKLGNGLLAKMTNAFDTVEDGTPQGKIDVSAVEYSVYMEMWCLRKLDSRMSELSDDMQATVASHTLRKFVLGVNPWAPAFHGVCKEDSGSQHMYIVMEDMLANFRKPCQVDLKLGYSTVEPESLESMLSEAVPWKERLAKAWKKVRHTAGDLLTSSVSEAVRPAGYIIFDPFTEESNKPQHKVSAALSGLGKVFDMLFTIPGHQDDMDTFQTLKDRLLSMAGWWGAVGRNAMHTVALSVLMAYECAPFQTAGTLFVSNLHLEKGHSNLAGQPYIVLDSYPKRKLYQSKSALGNSSGLTPTGVLDKGGVYKTEKAPSWNNPAWAGLEFALDFAETVSELVMEVRTSTDSADMHAGRITMGLEKVTASLKRHCTALQVSPSAVKGHQYQTTLCFDARRTYAERAVQPVAQPAVKLIDYAHFFTSDETPDWPQDGVYEGLLSVIKHLDMKESAAEGRLWENGQRMKCSRPSNDFYLSRASCVRLGLEMDQKHITWRDHSDGLGECRLCNVLILREGALMTGQPWLIFRNPNFMFEDEDA